MVISLRAGESGIIFLAIALALLVGCSSSRREPPSHQAAIGENVATGIILIDVLESGHPEYYWQYELQPSTGLVRKTKEEKFKDYAHEDIPQGFQRPTGTIEGCEKDPEATSPDGKYLARCTGSEIGLFLLNKKTSQTVYQWTPSEWRRIRGFAWSPNSHSVAILDISSYYGNGPIELLSGLLGHPVPHDTIFLDILDVGTGKVIEYMVRKDVPYSFSRILNWSE